MLNNIAIWGGIVGMGVALLALLLMVFTKKDIADIVNRDVILFDQNFTLKKQAIEKAFKLLDDLEQNPAIFSNAEFVRLAKQSYNELLCVMTRQMLAEQFKNLALTSGALTAASLAKFKYDCRRDIGFKTRYIRPLQNVQPSQQNLKANSANEKPAVTASVQPSASSEAPRATAPKAEPATKTPRTTKK